MKKNVDIFLKTYNKDFQWLPYLFASIDKYCDGFRSLVIVAEMGDNVELEKIKFPQTVDVKIHYIQKPSRSDGYMFQQSIKLSAWKYTDADAVMFIDSDCIFKKKISPSYFFKRGKIEMLKTSYAEIGSAVPWQKPTQDALGFPVYYEYMRRHPMLYLCSTLRNLASTYPHLEAEVIAAVNRVFSEFNVIGAYAEKFESDKYNFLDTATNKIPEEVVMQNWSWGGLTEEVIKKINKYL